MHLFMLLPSNYVNQNLLRVNVEKISVDLALQRTYHLPESNAFNQIQRKQTQKGSNIANWNVFRMQTDSFPNSLVDLLLPQIIYLGNEADFRFLHSSAFKIKMQWKMWSGQACQAMGLCTMLCAVKWFSVFCSGNIHCLPERINFLFDGLCI